VSPPVMGLAGKGRVGVVGCYVVRYLFTLARCLSMSYEVVCPVCNGTGLDEDPNRLCPECDGTGFVDDSLMYPRSD